MWRFETVKIIFNFFLLHLVFSNSRKSLLKTNISCVSVVFRVRQLLFFILLLWRTWSSLCFLSPTCFFSSPSKRGYFAFQYLFPLWSCLLILFRPLNQLLVYTLSICSLGFTTHRVMAPLKNNRTINWLEYGSLYMRIPKVFPADSDISGTLRLLRVR